MLVDERSVADSWATIVLEVGGEGHAGGGVEFTALVEGVAQPLDDGAGRLASRGRGRRDLADCDSRMDRQRAHVPQPRIHFDLDDLHRAWDAGPDRDVRESA